MGWTPHGMAVQSPHDLGVNRPREGNAVPNERQVPAEVSVLVGLDLLNRAVGLGDFEVQHGPRPPDGRDLDPMAMISRARELLYAGQGDLMSERTSLTYKIHKAAAQPERVVPYFWRSVRNMRLRLAHRDHTAFYRAVMANETAKDPDRAIGSDSRDSWMHVGKVQYDYLLRHGLRPEHRLLDIGCGNLRAGWRLAQHFDPGNYYGVDISPDILLAAQDTIRRFDLQDRVPYLTVVRDLRLDFLPSEHFDVVTAHSVFSHTPIEVIDQALAHVGRLLRPNGWFDFTYFETSGPPRNFLKEDFYYPTAQLLDLARSHSLAAEKLNDWNYAQAKIRVTRS